jgi:hypothetical protein
MGVGHQESLPAGLFPLQEIDPGISVGSLEAGSEVAEPGHPGHPGPRDDGDIVVAMAVKTIPSLDKKGQEDEDQDAFDDAESLHGVPPCCLFDAQDPQQERDEDQEIHGHILDTLLFPDEIPDEEADEIDRDQII